MSEKENSSDEESLEEAIADIAQDQPQAGEGDEPDHVELTALLEDARGKADEHRDQCLRLQADIENLHKRGEESGYQMLDECSMVTSPYSVDGDVLGVLGVIGPTRMAYDRVIPIVDATARLLGAALNQKD